MRISIGRIGWHCLAILVTLALAIEHDSICDESTGQCAEPSHTVIRLAKRDDELARQIAADHDMHVKGEPFLDSHYFLYHSDTTRTRRHKRAIVERLDTHPAVEWVEEQRPKRRVKRDYLLLDDDVQHATPIRRSVLTRNNNNNRRAQRQQPQSPREIPSLPFPDPLYKDQWYLHGGAVGGYDMNVRQAWQQGYAGRNVSISILDDGIQRDHPDLAANYDPLASTDINDHDDDPTPQNNGDNKHGTRCAGEVAALAGNNQCGVGVAFKSKIGGVRMLDGAVSDSVEAASLSLNQDHIDIYSASWGPEDDGKTFDGPGPLAREAFYRGIKNGRGGKGNIFVWASGNGGSRQDSCSADGYTTSVYTLSISSATFDNHRPWYLEECPSSIATTYSSADFRQPAIVTVDVPGGCTDKHTGTSASAPLAAGIIALALEANPELTWRDMQHIVLRTANWKPLENNPGWSRNGVGRMVSNKFGYGLMDGGALVNMAKTWKTVPEQHICTYEYRLANPNPRPIVGRFQLNFTLDVNGCESGTPVLYLEHVQVHATVRYLKRGDLKLTLFSPSGTRSVLLPPRPQDFNANGFHKWPFLSVQQWGEDPRGTWLLMVESVTTNPAATGTFHDWTLLLYGTADPAQPGDPVFPATPATSQGVLSRVQQLTSQSENIVERSRDSAEVSDEENSYWRWDHRNYLDKKSLNPMKKTSGFQPEICLELALLVEDTAPISFPDLTSAGNCHAECNGGCTESSSATSCFACKHLTQTLRNKGGSGFKCVQKCDDTYYLDGDKCKMCSSHCHTCSRAEVCETCPGSQLLIDVDNMPHFDHGKCVERCPQGLVADYETNLVQAKCIWTKDLCGDGYYINVVGKCDQCDSSCETCTAAGPMNCEKCAKGYGKGSIGYCRPCCAPGANKDWHCEDCSKLDSAPSPSSSSSGYGWMFWITVLLLLGLGVWGCWKCAAAATGSSVEYAPLPSYNASNGAINLNYNGVGEEESEEEEDELFVNVPASQTV